jgi:hypothetical protein
MMMLGKLAHGIGKNKVRFLFNVSPKCNSDGLKI